jgi:hypothetical protein
MQRVSEIPAQRGRRREMGLRRNKAMMCTDPNFSNFWRKVTSSTCQARPLIMVNR